jgi:hypothetical protein
MKPFQTIFLFLLTLAAVVFLVIAERPDRPRTDDVSGDLFLPDLAASHVARIEIAQLLDGATLERDGEGWRVTAVPEPRMHPADARRAEAALRELGSLRTGVLVSENPEHRSRYQVDAAGLRVRLLRADGTALAELVVGRNGPAPGSTYLRREGEDRVFLVDRPLAWLLSPAASDWRDRTLWSLDPAHIRSIELRGARGSVQLLRGDDGAWRAAPEGAIEDGAIPALVARLAEVKAEDVQDEGAATDAALVLRIAVAMDDGTVRRLAVGPADEKGRHQASLEGRAETYFFSEKAIASLAPPPAPAAK